MARCIFVIEDDHPKAYLKYVSLANPNFKVAFNRNGKPRQASRVPYNDHRSVLFVEIPLSDSQYDSAVRTRRHGGKPKKTACCKENSNLRRFLKHLLAKYCKKKKLNPELDNCNKPS